MLSWIKKLQRWLKPAEAPKPQPIVEPTKTPEAPVEAESLPPTHIAAPVQPVREGSPPAERPKAPTPRMPPKLVVDLHIGLDLGTSCSKIVIGDSFLNNFHAVPFSNGNHGVKAYLCPTRFFDNESRSDLSPLPEASTYADLKMKLMDAIGAGDDSIASEENLAIYVALLLRHTIAWFDAHHAINHRTRDICWHLNVGFPAKRTENHPKLHKAYTRACNAAIHAANSGEPITRTLIRNIFRGDDDTAASAAPRLAKENLHFYPEIAAQLAGYIHSPYYHPGPLMLIDIGAGTLDVSTLILHTGEGEEVCSFHFCEVQNLGAFRLYRRIYDSLCRISPRYMQQMLASGDELGNHLPTSLKDYFTSQQGVTVKVEEVFKHTLANFEMDCLGLCESNFSRFKVYLDKPFREINRRPQAFRDGVNFILSGGGARADFYKKLFPRELERRLLRLTSWEENEQTRRHLNQGLKRIHFPLPPRFFAPNLEKDDFDRLSVAHGLSVGRDALMKITATEVADRQWQ